MSTLTVRELAARLVAGELPPRAVALTFDDAFASVADAAAPLLLERGQRATVFAVSGYLGQTNDWPTNPAAALRRPLASADQLRALSKHGFEIGSHGVAHEPLGRCSADLLRRELVESRRDLEAAIGAHVTSFAFPYGSEPGAAARPLLEQTYAAACAGGFRRVRPDSDPLSLPRIDAHYLRRPRAFRAAVLGLSSPYLALRRTGARARRLARADYSPARPA
jgi:peptidoglycan/xylan/chitin deacetylase (PgdA/CDA1 family)